MPRWTYLAFAGLCVAALVGTFVYPTYPTYDSYYALLWGREVLDGQLPVFEGFRAPTQHPLAIVVAMLLELVPGGGGDRLWILVILASFLALVAGVYRLAAVAFTPLVGAVAAVLALSRFDFAFLAVRGYIDIPYLALVVWAVALEAQRPRRGTVVFALLTAAGLLRPEAWLLAGLYWLWLFKPSTGRQRVDWTAWALAAPLLWALVDEVVTGDTLYSLNSTSDSAGELGRSVTLADVPGAVPDFLVSLVKLPVALAGAAGLAAAVWLMPRRAVWPGVLLVSSVVTFVAIAAAGLSAIERYLVLAALALIIFAAVAAAGWTLLERGSRLRTAWMAAAGVAVAVVVVFTVANLDLQRFDSELGFRGDSHASLVDILEEPAVRDALECGPLTLPNHKLVPDARYVADLPFARVRERVQDPRQAGGVAIVVVGRYAVFKYAWTNEFDPADVQLPPDGFNLVARTDDYAAYARCA
ncbi:MAG: hypothetical protein WKF94_10415 [Solirubrobacteraceae bacterium]